MGFPLSIPPNTIARFTISAGAFVAKDGVPGVVVFTSAISIKSLSMSLRREIFKEYTSVIPALDDSEQVNVIVGGVKDVKTTTLGETVINNCGTGTKTCCFLFNNHCPANVFQLAVPFNLKLVILYCVSYSY